MKWEIEGELYLGINYYDQYEVTEPYIITADMNRDNIIYKGVGHRFNFEENKWEYDEKEKQICTGEPLSDWVESFSGLTPTSIQTYSEVTPYKNSSFCSKYESSFQPKTKKVRITIEEIE